MLLPHASRGLLVPALIALMVGAPLRAETLLDLFTLAKDNEPQFLAATHEYLAAKEKLPQANANLLPKITFDLDYIKTHQNIASSNNPVYALGSSDFDTRDYTVNLTQPVLDLSAIARRRQAESEVDVADAELQDAQQDLALLVSTRYFEALTAQDRLELVDAELAAVEENYKLAETRTSQGISPLTDLYDASARLETVKAQRVEARNKLADAMQALRELTGSVPATVSPLRIDFRLVKPVPEDGDMWVTSAMQQNIGLAIQKCLVKVAKEEIDVRKDGHWPTITLLGRHNRRDAGGSLFGGGSDIINTDLYLRLSLPVYSGGQVTSRTREAAELMEVTKHILTQKTRAVVREVWAAYTGILGTIYRVRALSKSVDAQKLTLEAKKSGLESGLYTGLAVLDAEHDVNQAKLDYAQARYEYVLFMLRLKRAVGGLREDDVKKINGWLASVAPATAP